MALGLQGQIKEIKTILDAKNRYIDIAVQFQVWDIINKKTQATEQKSKVYGGRFDVWDRKYVEGVDIVNILPCSLKQFELIESESNRIESSGGRGGGKSEAGVLRCLRYVCENPGEFGEIVSPSFRLTKILWEKILAMIPSDWILPGALGIKKSEREIVFINGSKIRFCSADNPNSLRSWGGHWAFLDEFQNVTLDAIHIIWPSLRLSANPMMWMCGTPLPGEALEIHEKNVKDPDTLCLAFDSYSNPFVDHRTFEIAKKFMDEMSYRREILAEWVFESEINLVAYPFSREKNMLSDDSKIGVDITSKITSKRCGKSAKYIIGCDYNFAWLNYAVVYKIFSGNPNIWVAIEVITS